MKKVDIGVTGRGRNKTRERGEDTREGHAEKEPVEGKWKMCGRAGRSRIPVPSHCKYVPLLVPTVPYTMYRDPGGHLYVPVAAGHASYMLMYLLYLDMSRPPQGAPSTRRPAATPCRCSPLIELRRGSPASRPRACYWLPFLGWGGRQWREVAREVGMRLLQVVDTAC